MLTKALLSIGALALLAAAPHELPTLTIGTSLPKPDQSMMDVNGKEFTLKQIAGTNGLLVVFSCNTCPFVVGSEGSEGWEGRYPAIGDLCKKNGIGFALVNSNEAKRTDDDSFDEMKAHYRAKGYNGHYLVDKDHVVADAFGARTTPHVYLFDKNMKLAYIGAIDDNVGSAAAATAHYLNDAINNMVAGKPIDPATTRNKGCSIKRVEHTH
ncbi:MAG: thioredoxin family protein [Flavobacteriales bacterium]